jgi:Ca2+-binding RTX toxin-like protein
MIVNGTSGNDSLTGSSGSDTITGFGGNDTLSGADGDDVFVMSSGTAANYGTDSIMGGAGFDVVDFSGVAGSAVVANISAATATMSGGGSDGGGSASVPSIEGVIGGDFADRLTGGGAANLLVGGAGNDTLDGSSGNDTLHGGAGADSLRGGSESDQFVFAEAPTLANADVIRDFTTGVDKLVLDRSVFAALGASPFVGGDARFKSGAFSSGQDGDDRIIYNTTTGQVFYDADGSGAGGAQLIVTLQGAPAPTLLASDIVLTGEGSDPQPQPGPGQGTAGNDSLVGTEGNDSIAGLAGNDTIDGLGGNDTLDGGTGVDLVRGGAGDDTLVHITVNDPGPADTLDGGSGNDTYDLREPDLYADHRVVLMDGGGTDTVLVNHDFTLPTGFENLTSFRAEDESNTLIGNASNNVITSMGEHDVIDGAGGNDTIFGGAGGDTFLFRAAPSGDYGQDTIDGGDHFGGEGVDTLIFDGARGGVVVDLRAGTATGSGISVSFSNIESVIGSPFDDHLTAHDGVEIEADFFSGAGLSGEDGNDTLIGGASADGIAGGRGNDDIRAGGGDDRIGFGGFAAENYGNDTVDGGAGIDAIFIHAVSPVTVDLSAGTMRGGGEGGTGSATLTSVEDVEVGGSTNDSIIGSGGANSLTGDGGYDTIRGGGGNDIIRLWGVEHTAELPAHAELFGEGGNDTISRGGGQGAVLISGGTGNDTLGGGLSFESLDRFLFAEAPGSANADVIFGFEGGSAGVDKIELDAAAFSNIGPAGNFTAEDSRWSAGPGLTAGKDVADRVIYNTDTGQLFYDADGSGAGASQLIATLNGAPSVGRTAIVVVGQGQPNPPPGQGTAGNDSLTGTAGNDSLAGLAGNDTLSGLAGNDTLDAGTGADRLVGGPGDDLYIVDDSGDVVIEAAGEGTDLVQTSATRTLDANVENLTLTGSSAISGTGNALNNVLTGNGANNVLSGLAGNDTLLGGVGNDTISMSTGGTSTYGTDRIDGGSGFDTVDFAAHARSALTVDLAAGQVTGGGDAGAGSAVLISVERVIGGDFGDRFTGNSSANSFDARGGNDNISGGGGNDTMLGGSGNDRLTGGSGNDSLTGGSGVDHFVFLATPSQSGVDRITDFASGTDELLLDNAAFTALGGSGAWGSTDGRFRSGAGVTTGRDSSDRLIYDTSADRLYYDADGSGSGGSVLVATFAGNPTLSASDITII